MITSGSYVRITLPKRPDELCYEVALDLRLIIW